MLLELKQKAIKRRQANKFIRRWWTIGSSFRWFPDPANLRNFYYARVVGVLADDMIRISLDIGEETWLRELNRYSWHARPMRCDLDYLLTGGWMCLMENDPQQK